MMISIQQLTKSYGEVKALRGVDLSVEKGELFALLGPNGAGKTTMVRIMTGLTRADAGTVLLRGYSIYTKPKEIRRIMGYMPDFFGVYEDMLVWEYLDFFARCYEIPAERRQRVTDELLELVDLNGKRDAYVQTLSRGMRQRLCLAHALVHDPAVLLLDEPASGLDPRARVEMRELLRELGAMGKTIIVSSHILSELAELCDWVGIIERGKLVASGSMEEINRLAQQGRTLRIQPLPGELETLEEALRGQPGVGEIYPLNGALEVAFTGDEEAVAALLASLVAAGVRITSFTEASSSLEETFLRLTKGEVA